MVPRTLSWSALDEYVWESRSTKIHGLVIHVDHSRSQKPTKIRNFGIPSHRLQVESYSQKFTLQMLLLNKSLWNIQCNKAEAKKIYGKKCMSNEGCGCGKMRILFQQIFLLLYSFVLEICIFPCYMRPIQ